MGWPLLLGVGEGGVIVLGVIPVGEVPVRVTVGPDPCQTQGWGFSARGAQGSSH